MSNILTDKLRDSLKTMQRLSTRIPKAINDVDDDTDDNKRLAESAVKSTVALKKYIDGETSDYGPPAALVRKSDVVNSWVYTVAPDQVPAMPLLRGLRDDFDAMVSALSGLDGDPDAATPAERLAELVAWANAHADQFDILQTATVSRNGFMTSQHVTDLYTVMGRLDIGTTPASALAAIGAAPAVHSHPYLPLAGGTVTGQVTHSNTTESQSVSSGAVVINGGLGVAKNIVGKRIISEQFTAGTPTTGFDIVYNDVSKTLDFIKRG